MARKFIFRTRLISQNLWPPRKEIVFTTYNFSTDGQRSMGWQQRVKVLRIVELPDLSPTLSRTTPTDHNFDLSKSYHPQLGLCT